MTPPTGILYIVGTPIGNLEDITLRALKVLQEVQIIAAEDTRHTQKLLNHYQIHSHLTSYHDHNKEEKAEILLQRLKEGSDVALLCDAGTPTISDPGYYLIKRAIQTGIRLVPIPGATALISALSVSGAPTDCFTFEGFPPRKQVARQRWFRSLQENERTILFYESPHRLVACLEDLQNILGNRSIVIARELTKTHEEILRGKITEILGLLKNKKILGEITVIIEGQKRRKKDKRGAGSAGPNLLFLFPLLSLLFRFNIDV